MQIIDRKNDKFCIFYHISHTFCFLTAIFSLFTRGLTASAKLARKTERRKRIRHLCMEYAYKRMNIPSERMNSDISTYKDVYKNE